MFKKMNLWVLAGLGLLTITGCATGGNRTSDSEMSSLNSRMSSLQNEMSSKDQEISKLRDELAEQRAQLDQLEAEKQAMANKLDDAYSDLNAAKAKATAQKTSQESDLK